MTFRQALTDTLRWIPHHFPRLGFLILISALLSNLEGMLITQFSEQVILMIVIAVILTTPQAFLLLLTLKLIQKPELSFSQWMEESIPFFPRILGGTLLYVAFVTVGGLLFLLPGIYFGIQFLFYGQFIIFRNETIADAFQDSKELSQHYFFPLLGIWFFALLPVLLLGGLSPYTPFPLNIGIDLVSSALTIGGVIYFSLWFKNNSIE
ncbi:MAG: hypothetical protein CL678_01785 [Bdellovibrionaceae bacterium]|nr:hypothetical protein [Pseudobdellovibrionaceae bacterium]|tara:strand:+ start:811 stop:1434 length:624 start_codon:yes stop_codon:yes gene_type:complete